MCLNPEKCTFGVGSGKFLDFMTHIGGLKPTPTNELPYWRCTTPPMFKKYKSSMVG